MPRSAPAPARQQLSPWDHLVLIGWQIKYNLDLAQKKWEQDFRDQLKTYLLTRPPEQRELISANIIKVSIVEKGGNTSLNVASLEEAFKNMIRNPTEHGRFLSREELKTLIESGVLGVKDPEAAFNFLHARGQVETRLLVETLPSAVTQSLTWKVLTNTATAGAGVLADLPDRIHTASGARLDDQDIALMLPQTEPAVPQASETVAVRRPRRTRGSVQPPEQP